MNTVFVVDHALQARDALSRRLTSVGYGVHSFESAESFLAAQTAATPGCLLIEPCMPGMNGLELQRALLGTMYPRPIVFLSAQADVSLCVKAMKAGAVDFLTQPIDDVRLFGALDHALRLDRDERGKRAVRRIVEQRLERLTPRERQVMEQVVLGRLNKQIAAALGTGEKNVKVHRGRAMTKMGVESVAELVLLADRVGIAMDVTLRISRGRRGPESDAPSEPRGVQGALSTSGFADRSLIVCPGSDKVSDRERAEAV